MHDAPAPFVALDDNRERAQLREALRQAQRMEAAGRLAGGMAHDFKNLLTVVTGYCELLLGRLPPGDPARAQVAEIHKAGERAVALTRQLLAFSRRQPVEPRPLDLNEAIAGLEPMLARVAGDDITVEVRPAAGLGAVRADPGQIEQVLVNLVDNARDAMPRGGRITVATANAELGEEEVRRRPDVRTGPYVVLELSDTGSGMDAATRSRLFEPFFTTKEKGRGTGLGLFSVLAIVQQGGGHVEVLSEPGNGSSFRILLPRCEAAAAAPAPAPAPAAVPGGSETVLVAEDSEPVRRLIRDILTESGYAVLAAGSGEEALRICREHPGEIHLLVSDAVMPGMSGAELIESGFRLRPAMRALCLSAFADRSPGEGARAAFLEKHFTVDALRRMVRHVLDSRP